MPQPYIKSGLLLIGTMGLTSLHLPLLAAEEVTSREELLTAVISQGIAKKNSTDTTTDTIATIREALGSPNTQSTILNSYLQSDHGWQFLKDINLAFKVFESDENSEAALGITYEYEKSLKDYGLECNVKSSACTRGLDFAFSTEGNVAFDGDRNPADFLDTELSFNLYQSLGGTVEGLDPDLVIKLRDVFIRAEDESEEEEAVQDLITKVRPALTNQFYFEIGGHASLESDQDFDAKQWTYGIHTVLELKSWNTDNALSKLNFFDYPFALIRAVSDYDSCTKSQKPCFQPLGTSWPSALIGLSRVQPEGESPRALSGDDSDFDRLKLEISFKSPIARVKDQSYFFALNYRYFAEISPSDVVEEVGQDSIDYLAITIGADSGVFFSYTDGRLPFDLQDDQVYQLGYKFHF